MACNMLRRCLHTVLYIRDFNDTEDRAIFIRYNREKRVKSEKGTTKRIFLCKDGTLSLTTGLASLTAKQ